MIVVIADDFSGAAEMAGIASRYYGEVEIATCFPEAFSCDVLVIDTNTRLLPDQEAEAKVGEVCDRIRAEGITRIFKKVDSVLRGPVRVEIQSALNALGLRKAVLAPANPSRDRLIRGGRYLCGGVPLHESEFANDPMHPVRTSEVNEMVGEASFVTIPEIANAGAWGSIVEGLGPDVLPVGAADFFTAWLGHITGEEHVSSPETVSSTVDREFERRLWVCGSLTSWEKREADFANHCIPCVVFSRSPVIEKDRADWWAESVTHRYDRSSDVAMALGDVLPDRDPVSLLTTLSAVVLRICQEVPVSQIHLEGGATARAVADRFGDRRWRVDHELSPGVVKMAPSTPGLENAVPALVIKPGSYSWPESLFPAVPA